MYNIILSKKSQKFLDKQSQSIVSNIAKKLIILSNGLENKNLDIKKIVNQYSIYRLRVGKYRILFNIDHHNINIIDIRSRGQSYK